MGGWLFCAAVQLEIATQIMWCEPTFESVWLQQTQNTADEPISAILSGNGWLLRGCLAVCKLAQTAVYLFALLYLIANGKTIRMSGLLLGIAFLGGFLFHLVWEAKGQYAVTYFVLLIPYAVQGYGEATQWGKGLLKKHSEIIRRSGSFSS